MTKVLLWNNLLIELNPSYTLESLTEGLICLGLNDFNIIETPLDFETYKMLYYA